MSIFDVDNIVVGAYWRRKASSRGSVHYRCDPSSARSLDTRLTHTIDMLEAGSTSPKSSYALCTDFLVRSVGESRRNVLMSLSGNYNFGHHGLVVRGDTEAFEVGVRFPLRHQTALKSHTYFEHSLVTYERHQA
jgi:hypothetical protein